MLVHHLQLIKLKVFKFYLFLEERLVDDGCPTGFLQLPQFVDSQSPGCWHLHLSGF
jgi:hypothetical protein